MNIDIMTDIKSVSQSKHQAKNSVVDDDGLFQQLLQSNKKSVNLHETSHATKQQFINDEKESEDLEQNPDILNMIAIPLEHFVEVPVKLNTGSVIQNEDNHLNNAELITEKTVQHDAVQQSKTLIAGGDIDTNQSVIINEPITMLVKSTHENHLPDDEITKPEINSKLIELGSEITPRPLPFDISLLEGEVLPQRNITHNINNIAPHNNIAESNFLAQTSNKALMIDMHQMSSFITDNPMPNPVFSPATSTLQTMNLSMPVDISQWQTSLTEQIVMLSREDIQTAEIKLHPEELGSLHIKLTMHDDKMHLHMMTAHNVVKGVLESALPFLRTSLEEQGITLQQADVSNFSMMNDSQQQSSMFKQPHNIKRSALVSQDEKQRLKQSSLNQTIVSSGLSIFA